MNCECELRIATILNLHSGYGECIMLEQHIFDDTFPLRRKFLAWGVHFLTASSAVFGFLAILAIIQMQWQTAVFWMGTAAFIDAIDGGLSRRAQVKAVLPNFDGTLLDNIVDYQTYVLVPALFVYQAGLVPPFWTFLVPAFVLLASAYQFSQADAKTDDHYFKGFPSYWNVVVAYLFLLQTSHQLNLWILATCAVLVFVPIKYLYPSRMTRYRKLTLVLGIIWMVMLILSIIQYPSIMHLQWAWLSLFFIAYYIGLSVFLMWQPGRKDE